ncbi:MAG: S1C family serine protease, partial [Gaiellaceae bacterium]
MRSGVVVLISLVAAVLGATLALVVASSADWVGHEDGVRTVVLPRLVTDTAASTGATATAAVPLAGNGFDPARIYATRSNGVVTLYSFFSGGERAQGSGFVVSKDGHVLTNSHVVTNAGEAADDDVKRASRVYVVFADGDRIPGEIVGWDLFNDTGLVKFDPKQHAVRPLPLGDSNRVVVGQPVAAIGSPFGNQN